MHAHYEKWFITRKRHSHVQLRILKIYEILQEPVYDRKIVLLKKSFYVNKVLQQKDKALKELKKFSSGASQDFIG